MPTQFISWKCNICKQVYLSAERAESCEKQHTPISAIKIIKVTHDNGPEGFPWHLDVTIDHNEATKSLTATYKVDSVIDNNDNVIYKDSKRF